MKILILFSTLSGITEMVSKVIQESLVASGHLTTLHNVWDSVQVDLSQYDALVFGAPTYDGRLEMGMEQYISQTAFDLSKYKIAIFGLGDTAYPQYCTSADILEKWVTTNSGKLAFPSLRIDGYPLETEYIDVWAKQVSKSFVKEIL